jgi:hypothetical protein
MGRRSMSVASFHGSIVVGCDWMVNHTALLKLPFTYLCMHTCIAMKLLHVCIVVFDFRCRKYFLVVTGGCPLEGGFAV